VHLPGGRSDMYDALAYNEISSNGLAEPEPRIKVTACWELHFVKIVQVFQKIL
jgi:hypothetical protein